MQALKHPAVDDEWRLRLYEAELSVQHVQMTAVLAFATAVLRSLFLLNGGAIVAILAFYGEALAGGAGAGLRPAALIAACGFFAAGLVAAVGCAGAAYLGQLVHAESARPRAARTLRWGALLAGLASLTLFALGACRALGLLG